MKSATFCTAEGLTSSPFFFSDLHFSPQRHRLSKKKNNTKKKHAQRTASDPQKIIYLSPPFTAFSKNGCTAEPDSCEDITAADFQTFPGKVELAKWTERSRLLVPLLGRSSAEASKRNRRRLRERAQGSQGTSSNHRWFSTRIQSGG